MFNAVRMDIYRLIHTKSAYVILVIAMALAIAMSGMTALVRSMAAESIVETTDEVTMVSESDSEIADEYDTASAESSNGPTATVGLEMDESDMSDEVPTIADMVESDIAGLDLALLLAIFTVLFSTADLNSGYIKSVGGQVKCRGVRHRCFYMEQNSEMQQTYLRCLAASMWSHFYLYILSWQWQSL